MSSPPFSPDHPFHAHIYFDQGQRGEAERLRQRFLDLQHGRPGLVDFVGDMIDRPVGPHPLPQYEIHFPRRAISAVRPLIIQANLRALVHPLTDHDLDDHTTLASWIGAPLALDVTVLDPPGRNQALARYGKSDF